MKHNLCLEDDEFVSSLKSAKNVNAHYKSIDTAAQRGEASRLQTLFSRIEKECPFGVQDWAPLAALERITESLSLSPGLLNAEVAIQLAIRLRDSKVFTRPLKQAVAQTASRLAAVQDALVIEGLLSKPYEMETKASLLHEAVVRNKISSTSEIARDLGDDLKRCGHPLGSLPLELLPEELDLPLPHYGSGLIGWSMPFGPSYEEKSSPKTEISSRAPWKQTTSPQREQAMSSAVMNWQEESNGQIEARIFYLESPFTNFGDLLPQLELESIGHSPIPSPRPKSTLREVLQILFSASANGGAYNQGVFPAYGRLLTWRSIGALIGAPDDTEVGELARIARTCSWCLFYHDSDWFYRIAWDIGIACWNPSRCEITVLCATDTD